MMTKYNGFLENDTDILQLIMNSVLAYGTVVEKADKDRQGMGMVKVRCFLKEKGKDVSEWAPVVKKYAGKKYGLYCLPEIGDTVVVGFINGNMNTPVVFGSVFDKNNRLPDDMAAEEKGRKGFFAKNGSQAYVDDIADKSKLTVKTPKGLLAVMDDEAEKIIFSDGDGKNCIEFDMKSGEITFSAAKKINFNVNGKTMLSLDGTAGAIKAEGNKVDLNGSQALNIKGGNTQLAGTMLALKGDSSAKVESSGMLQIKGTMVKIN